MLIEGLLENIIGNESFVQKDVALSIPLAGELVDSGVVGEMMWFASTGVNGDAAIAMTTSSGVTYMHDEFHSDVYAARTVDRSIDLFTSS